MDIHDHIRVHNGHIRPEDHTAISDHGRRRSWSGAAINPDVWSGVAILKADDIYGDMRPLIPTKFTNATGFTPAPVDVPEPWLTTEAFEWVLVYGDPSQGSVIVPAGFPFDGASIPPPVTLLLPRVHPSYMQSAALHDWLLKHERHRFSRHEIDLIFKEALRAQKNPPWRVNAMYAGVRPWGIVSEGRGYWKTKAR